MAAVSYAINNGFRSRSLLYVVGLASCAEVVTNIIGQIVGSEKDVFVNYVSNGIVFTEDHGNFNNNKI
jgi:hypothetical protein